MDRADHTALVALEESVEDCIALISPFVQTQARLQAESMFSFGQEVVL